MRQDVVLEKNYEQTVERQVNIEPAGYGTRANDLKRRLSLRTQWL